MLDLNTIRENPDRVREKLALRNTPSTLVDEFLKADNLWRDLVSKRDEMRAQQKLLGRDSMEEAKELKIKIQKLEEDIKLLSEKRDDIILHIPNLPSDEVPIGKDDSENVVVREVGEKPNFNFKIKDHVELGKSLNLFNTEKAGQVAGARFNYILNELVLLEFGLIQLAFKEAIKLGFIPVLPPVLVKPEILKGMGKGKFLDEKEAFYLPEDDLYLVGSAEHTMGPYHADEILNEKDLPLRYIAFSTAFRREAGSYGKDTKGMLRVHQFDKAELFSFTHPDKSKEEHKFLVEFGENLMKKLKLPYRVLDVCTGDMTFSDVRQFDIEAFMPGQNTYRETHSCSNTGDYQARGINTRFRDKDGEVRFVHTLNGTAFSQRPLIAIMENYQTENGSIIVPDVLREYVGQDIITRNG